MNKHEKEIVEINSKIQRLEEVQILLDQIMKVINWNNTSYIASPSPIAEMQREVQNQIQNFLYSKYLLEKER